MSIEARFYETYELCSIVDGVLAHRFEYLRNLEGFHCDGNWTAWVQPFQKFSAFHQFISFIVQGVHREQADAVDLERQKERVSTFKSIPVANKDLQPDKLPIEFAFSHYGIELEGFSEYLRCNNRRFEDASEDDVYEFMNEVQWSEPYERLLNQTVAEVFHVLFQNRSLLLAFNDYVSGILRDADLEELETADRLRFSKNGRLKRVKPPRWARRAVFFRDRGRCVLCNSDLSGLINLENAENFDHIVPISQFGLNDISNLQLLCVLCNQHEKRGGAAVTSIRYQSWY